MKYHLSLLISLFATAPGCSNTAITKPVTANTWPGISSDGYEAALATAEAGEYPILEKDPKQAFLRLRSRVLDGQDTRSSVCYEIRAWTGTVDVLVKVPPGLALAESQVRRLRSERRELVWAISKRARMIAGEPFGDAVGVPSSAFLWPQRGNQSVIIIYVPPTT